MTSRVETYGKKKKQKQAREPKQKPKQKQTKEKGRTHLKWKIGIVVLLTLAQWGGMYGINKYLEPPAVAAIATAVQPTTAEAAAPPAVTAPADAVTSMVSYDGQHVAYTTSDGKFKVADKNGVTFEKELNGDVAYMQWLGHSNTVLYGVQGTYLDAWLLPAQGNEPVLIHEWYGKERKIAQTYFSSYMEFLYLEVDNEQDQTTEVYKYDALGGISQLPLENVKIASINYDEKTDIMQLTQESNGGVWRYEKDRLYRPDGSEVYQETIVHHTPVTGNSEVLNPSNGTGETSDPSKTESSNTEPGKSTNEQSNGTGTATETGKGTDGTNIGGTTNNGTSTGGTGGTTNGGATTGGNGTGTGTQTGGTTSNGGTGGSSGGTTPGTSTGTGGTTPGTNTGTGGNTPVTPPTNSGNGGTSTGSTTSGGGTSGTGTTTGGSGSGSTTGH